MEEIQIESFKFRLRYPPDLTGATIYVPPPSPKSQTERNETENVQMRRQNKRRRSTFPFSKIFTLCCNVKQGYSDFARRQSSQSANQVVGGRAVPVEWVQLEASV